MKRLLLVTGAVGLLFLSSCEEHEIIPAPLPMVDLDCECSALVGDSSVAYIDTCKYSSTKTISTTALSEAQYKTSVQNSSMVQGFSFEMRSCAWNDDGSNNPTSADWQAFFNDNMTPSYSTDLATNGIYITWVDPNNVTWASDTGTVCFSNFIFNSFVHDSDTTGEYMQFEAVFNGHLKTSGYGTVDSVKCVQNGYVKSAFRLE